MPLLQNCIDITYFQFYKIGYENGWVDLVSELH